MRSTTELHGPSLSQGTPDGNRRTLATVPSGIGNLSSRSWLGCALTGGIVVLLLFALGENTPSESPAEHTEIGPNGGLIVEIGNDAHAEVVASADGKLVINFLDESLASRISIDDTSLGGFLMARNGNPNPEPIHMVPIEAEVQRSCFEGTIPEEYRGETIAVVFPLVLLKGQRVHVDFELQPRQVTQPEKSQAAGKPEAAGLKSSVPEGRSS